MLNLSRMPFSLYKNSPGYSTAYCSVGSCVPTMRSPRMSILFYSGLSFTKLLFHLHM